MDIGGNQVTLRTLSLPAKLLVTCVLLTLGTGYIFAISNIALRIGLTQADIVLHYYGNEASRLALEEIEQQMQTVKVTEVTEEETFSFDELEDVAIEVADEPLVPIPSLDKLVAEGHFHLFGYTSIFFLCGLVVLLAQIPLWLKNTLIIAPFAASVLDIWSILLTRFISANFAWMLSISGAVMAFSFLLVFAIGFYQTWFMKNNR